MQSPFLLRRAEGRIRAPGPAGWPVWSLLGLQLLVALPLAQRLNLWVDEVYSLHTTEQGPLEALSRGIHFERQAPLYFGLLSLWREIDSSVFFARIPSVLFVSLSGLVLVRIARVLFPDLHPAWFVAAFFLHPAAIWAAVEIRVYALSILLGALLLWIGLEAFFVAAPRRGALSAFVAVAVVSLYTYYYLGFVLVGLGVALAATGRFQALGRYAMAIVCIAALCAPIAWWLPAQTATSEGPHRLGFLKALRFGGNILVEAALPGNRLAALIGSRIGRWLARGLLGLLAVALVTRPGVLARLAREPDACAVWIVVAAVSLQFALVAWLIGYALVEDVRYWTYLSLPATIAVVSVPAATRRASLLGVVVALIVGAHVAELAWIYRPLAKPTDAERVAAFLMREEHAGEPILVFPNEWVLPIRYYYAGVNAMVPIPQEPSLEHYDPRDLAIRSEDQLEGRMRELPHDRGTLWLVKDAEIFRGRELLERYVDRHFVVDQSWPFYRKLVVQRLQWKEPSLPGLEGRGAQRTPPH